MTDPEGLQQLPHWSHISWPEQSVTQQARAETGPMRFGDDWPGVFIRGDNALAFANLLTSVLADQRANQPTAEWATLMLTGLRDLLRSCSVGDTGWPSTPTL